MKQSQTGLTMVELLVSLFIGAILMGIGIPSYRYVTNSNRTTTEINSLLGDMQYARSEAVKEGQPVTICPLTGTAPNYTCTGSNNWKGGWIIFSDVNGNASMDAGAAGDPNADVILRVQQPLSGSDTFTSDNNVAAVTYNREGFATGLPATLPGYVTVTLHTTPAKDDWTRCLQVATYGSVQTERVGTGGCL